MHVGPTNPYIFRRFQKLLGKGRPPLLSWQLPCTPVIKDVIPDQSQIHHEKDDRTPDVATTSVSGEDTNALVCKCKVYSVSLGNTVVSLGGQDRSPRSIAQSLRLRLSINPICRLVVPHLAAQGRVKSPLIAFRGRLDAPARRRKVHPRLEGLEGGGTLLRIRPLVRGLLL